MDVVDEVHQSTSFDHLLQTPEVVHYLDQDKHMSEVFRTGVPLPSRRQARSLSSHDHQQPATLSERRDRGEL